MQNPRIQKSEILIIKFTESRLILPHHNQFYFFIYVLSSIDLHSLINGADIVRFIKAERIRWLGHTQRINSSRTTKTILEWKPMGSRQTERPRKRWLSVCEGVKVTNVKTRKELALNRKAKKDLAERAKTHKGL